MSRDKIFVILLFLTLVFLTSLLLVLERKESPANNAKTEMIIKNIPDADKIAKSEESFNSLKSNIWIRPDSNPDFIPWRNWNVEEPRVEAKSAILMETKGREEKILFQRNIAERLPIASLTKIMTALIVLENTDLEKIIKISKEAVSQEGEAGKLVVGEEISVKNLLFAMLLESSNDATFALFSDFDPNYFIDLMNQKAQTLQLENTNFSNAVGFNDSQNFSTSYDFAKILDYSLKNQFLWQILKTSVFEVEDVSGKIFHHWENTNKLLGVLPNVVGGKTGWTREAGGCISLVIDNPQNNSKIIAVLLGAPDENKRFEEAQKLIDWVFKAYYW